MIYLRILWTILIMQLKQTILDGFVLFTVIVQPIIVAVLAIYMLRDTEGFQAIYVIVGSALTGLWSGTIYLASRGVEFERWSGTLEETVGSPTPLAVVVTGKGLANMVLALCSMLISYPIAAFAFGFRLTIAEPLLFAGSLVLTVVAFVAMALVIAPIFSLNPGSSVWSNPLEFLVYALSGFLFPIALLPIGLTPISYALSPYWAARAASHVERRRIAAGGLAQLGVSPPLEYHLLFRRGVVVPSDAAPCADRCDLGIAVRRRLKCAD